MAISDFMQKVAVAPLYEKSVLSEEDLVIINRYLEKPHEIKDDSIELYCIDCKKQSIFKPKYYPQIYKGKLTSIVPYVGFSFECTRDNNHLFVMQIKYFEDCIIKIGQYPSKGDIEITGWDKYSKVISNEYLSEIKTAVGLAAHGVGVGSFVYLRRVIEHLVDKASKEAIKNEDFNFEKYKGSSFKEKIVLLKDGLSKVLVDNKEVYSILSKGIHELDDKECLANFEMLKTAIELILDEMMTKNEKIEKENKLKKSITAIYSKKE